MIQEIGASKIAETIPVDATNKNGSFSYTYTSGNLTRIDWLIAGITYRRTLTYDGSDNLSTISAWVKV
jgi:hypothetical protein